MARRRDANEPYSYVHAGTRIDGAVVVEGRLRVDGQVRGEVRASGRLEVAPGGRIEGGPVRAAEVRIAGEVVADVEADGTVEVWRDGRLEGDVRAGSLDVEEGARFLGRSLMRDDAARSAPTPTSATRAVPEHAITDEEARP